MRALTIISKARKMATTLSEILQAKGDADYAQGGEGGAITKPDYTSAAANEYLQHAADLTFNAHRYLAEQHDQNMRETLKGLNDVDFKDLLPQDSQGLMGEYTGVIQDTANNFGVIRNPLSNPQQYAAMKAKESGFRQKLSQAQQDAAFLKKQAEFVQVHPEFNTPAYQENVKKFTETPVGQRQPFVVTPPLTFNPAATYKTIAELAKKKYANAATNGKYITQEEGEKTDPTQYNALATGPLAGVDQYGNSLETARKASYDNLPANIKAGYKDYNDYVTRQAAMYMPQDQVSKKEIKGDRFGEITAEGIQQRKTKGMEEAFEGKQYELNRENALIVAGMKSEKINPQTAAEAKMRNLAIIENTGTIDPELAQKLYGNNKKITVETPVPVRDNPEETDPKQFSYTNKFHKTIKEEMNTETFEKSYVDQDGNLHMQFKNTATGQQLPEKVVSHNQLYNDLDGMFGEKFKPQISGASSSYSQKTFGKSIPTIDDLRNHYGINQSSTPDNVNTNPAASGPTQIKSQKDYDNLPKGAQYIDPTDGKPYIKQ